MSSEVFSCPFCLSTGSDGFCFLSFSIPVTRRWTLSPARVVYVQGLSVMEVCVAAGIVEDLFPLHQLPLLAVLHYKSGCWEQTKSQVSPLRRLGCRKRYAVLKRQDESSEGLTALSAAVSSSASYDFLVVSALICLPVWLSTLSWYIRRSPRLPFSPGTRERSYVSVDLWAHVGAVALSLSMCVPACPGVRAAFGPLQVVWWWWWWRCLLL